MGGGWSSSSIAPFKQDLSFGGVLEKFPDPFHTNVKSIRLRMDPNDSIYSSLPFHECLITP